MNRSLPHWETRQGAIAGEVVLPGSPGYDSVRKPANARFYDVRPRAVVLCEAPEDVSETVCFARRSELRRATRSGGHCFAGRSSTEGIVIDVSPMSSVSVSDDVTTVGAGARLGDLYNALDEHGLTISAGCGPSAGISGLALGGGLGILGRKHGLTSDRLLGAQIVLADGRVVECDEQRDGELLWALRGAGGSFGVVTPLVFETLPAPAVTAFHLIWPHTHAAGVVDAWQAWVPYGPDELAASLLLTAPGHIDRPPVVNLFGAMIGTESDTTELLDELVTRVGADPTSAFRKQMSYRETKRYLAELGDAMAGDDDRLGEASRGEPSAEGHPYSKSEFFRRPLPAEAIVVLVEHLAKERVPGQSRKLDLTPWGGAYNRVPADATAFVHRDELFLLQHTVIVDPDTSIADREGAQRWLARSWASTRPWGSGGVYPNFPDPDLEDWAHAYYGTNYDRLVRAKARYDPDGFFSFHQSIPNRVLGNAAST